VASVDDYKLHPKHTQFTRDGFALKCKSCGSTLLSRNAVKAMTETQYYNYLTLHSGQCSPGHPLGVGTDPKPASAQVSTVIPIQSYPVYPISGYYPISSSSYCYVGSQWPINHNWAPNVYQQNPANQKLEEKKVEEGKRIEVKKVDVNQERKIRFED